MMFCKWFCLWGMRSHPWKFEMSGGREGVQVALRREELSVRSSMPSPREALWGSSQRSVDALFLWNRPCAALKAYSRPPESSVSCHLHFWYSGSADVLLTGQPWHWYLLQQRKPSPCSPSDGALLSVAPVFLPGCHFFFNNAFGGYFLFPPPPARLHISIFWPLGFVAQLDSEGEFLSLDRPGLLPSPSCCASTEGSSLLTVSCGGGCVSCPPRRSVGASPHRGFVIAALKENALSLLSTACCFLRVAPAHTRCPSPSKALLFPSVGSVLWSVFTEEKVIGKQEGEGKVISDLGIGEKNKSHKNPKFIMSNNRGTPSWLQVHWRSSGEGWECSKSSPEPTDKGTEELVFPPQPQLQNLRSRLPFLFPSQ